MVQPNMSDDGEVARDLRLVGSQCGDTAQERRDLGAAAQRLGTANLENVVYAECLGKPVNAAGVTGPVVSGERVTDMLTGHIFIAVTSQPTAGTSVAP
ncbi:hypothetical protein [Mycobacterium stomatepiae]|uniref:Uncharacterized protein n=1 Tax=Mycobacterium stomatepiae TaxID=470076 RepID=A0A7I7Q388_9MYCO|nr:hypothetical protein [Mycobacterium stomatepiae]MCV7165837.1 hypothetical protein [Mycobacterium stomatepiae]BBY20709.1 hypothetical protein MSTO_09140 [Mycobacterium stomatepiae]